ncbi:hypothetical protein [Legionella tunisiensis]|uniref:hypothetical protein n=1 Tax=Legionella tunisiensis TaxID=1034944 RepID=UPI0002E42C0B|nr:hypothetical protein [Legionella tunisiensis]
MKISDNIYQSKTLLIVTLLVFVVGVYKIPYKEVIDITVTPPTVVYSSIINEIIYGLGPSIDHYSGSINLLVAVYWLVSLLSVAGMIAILFMLHSLKARNLDYSNRLIITATLFIYLFLIESIIITLRFFITTVSASLYISTQYFTPVAFFIPVILLNLQILSLFSTPIRRAGRGLRVGIILTIITIFYILFSIMHSHHSKEFGHFGSHKHRRVKNSSHFCKLEK